MILISPMSLPLRRRGVTYVNGIAQTTETVTTIMAGVQPHDDTGDSQSELVLSREAIVVTTQDEVRAATDGTPADIIEYNGRKYVVRSSRYWGCVMPHFEVIAELTDE